MSGNVAHNSGAFMISTELFECSHQIATCLITRLFICNDLVMMAAQAMRFFVSQLEEHFEEPAINVTILEVFHKLSYDRPTQDQTHAQNASS